MIYVDYVTGREYDFTGCKYKPGQCVHDKRIDTEVATVWKIYGVSLNHGGENYYHCRANGFGVLSIYESQIYVSSKPVSDFFKHKTIDQKPKDIQINFSEEIKSAQLEMSTWSEERKNSTQLEGMDLIRIGV